MTDRETLLQEKAKALDLAKNAERGVQSLLSEYGSGARPSWVSADLAIERANRDRYLAQADEIDQKLEALAS